MAKQLNVDLNFNANTKQAKAEIESLNNILKSIQSTPSTLFDDSSIKNASKAAQELQGHLSKAFDVDTGKLDLSRFSTSLKQSGKSLEDYRRLLSNIGPTGEQAFLAISKSIASAETPTARVNKKMQEFATTLKNTARWQISSSILHGFMGALQSAYGYAKDLDESLNNIRIVTGKNAEEMARFAQEANRAAKALSTTTTEYTNASLIYYQQGLSEQEVKERSDITIKMANVSRQSAEIVSDQLTAIWNNFYDGTQSLEHYADAMTRLGADTASSSDEIAEGLEKFAAVGDMIGLSFDNAAAALATVTSQTRQSADVVGTAFKTIFARIQGLNLGETLDDGTTLNKYSKALMAVGINVKDASGQLKDMDAILDEMGSKWQTLAKDQQIALAQTVAGVRQYNQLVSLMDNFDYYKTLLDSAQNAEGTLQAQADIYAESWEAARDRVKAAAEGVYDSLINKDFFIGFDNGLAGLLEGVEGFVDGLGGMKGIILTLSGIFMQYFAKQMPQALANLSANLSVFTGKAENEANKLQQDNQKILESFDVSGSDYGWNAQVQGITTINKMTSELAKNQRLLSDEERQAYQAKIETIKAIYDAVAARGKELNATKQQTEELMKQVAVEGAENAVVKEANKNAPKKSQKSKKEVLKDSDSRKKVSSKSSEITKNLKALEKNIKSYEKLIQVQKKAQDQAAEWKKQAKAIGDNANELESLKEKMRAYADSLTQADQNSQAFQNFLALLDNKDASAEELANAFALLSQNGSEAFASLDANAAPFLSTIEELHQNLIDLGVDPSKLNLLEEQFRENAISAEEYEAALRNLEAQGEAAVKHQARMSEAVTSTVGAISSLGGVMTSVESAFDVFSDDDASVIQKIGAAIGLLTAAMSAYQGVVKAVTAIQAVYKASTSSAAATQVAASGAIAGAKTTETAAITANTAAWYTNPITAIIAAACLAAAAAIAIVSSAMEANSKKIAENADKWNEQADAQKQANEANRDTIASMREALNAYKEAQLAGDDLTDVKSELDSVTRALAEAYNLEGAALARLSGEYGSYENVLDQAIEKQKDELSKRLNTEQQAANAVATEMMDVARDGNGRKSGDDYLVDFEGWGKNEFGAQDAIMKYVSGATKDDALLDAGVHSISFGTDFNDPKALVQLYDELTQARAEMESTMSQKDLADSGIYAETVEWLTRMEETVTEYKGHLDQVALIQAELGSAKDMTLSDTDVDNYSEFTKWASEAEQSFINTGRSAEEAKKLVKELVDNSLNPDLSGYYEMSQALDEIKATGTTVSDKVLEKLWSEAAAGEGAFDQAALSMVNWGAVTQSNYKEACEAAQSYYDAQQKVVNAKTVSDGASQVSSKISKDGITSDNVNEIQSALDWGNKELGIIEFSEFLKMTAEEQQTYLQDLINGSQDDINQGLQDTINSSQKIIEQQRQAIAKYSASTQDAAQKTVNNWKLIQSEYNKYKQAVTAGTADEFVISDELSKALSSSGVTWDNVLNAEDFDSYMESKTSDAKIVLNTVANAEGLIASAQAQIDNAQEQIKINGLLDFNQAKEDVRDLVKELSGLGEGDTIDAEQYKILSEYLPQLKNQFVETADGTYKLASGLDGVQLSWRDLNAVTHENGGKLLSGEDIANTITSLNELQAAVVGGAISLEESRSRIKDIVESNLEAAASLDELRQAAVEGASYGGLDYNAYAENLIRLGEEYDNCTTELEEYQQALLSGDSAQIQAAESALELSIQIGELASQFSLDAKETENYAKRLAESLKIDEQTAVKLAVANQRVDRGLTNLNKNLEDYSKALKNNAKNSAKWSETMSAIKTDLADILNVADGEMLSDQFAEQVWASEDLKKALDGDVEAIERLKVLAADDIIINVVANQSEDPENIKSRWQKLKDDFAAIGDIDAPGVDHSKLLASFNEMIAAGNMTKDQIEAALAGLHVSANVKTTYVPQKVTIPQTITEEAMVNAGFEEVMVPGPDGEWVPQKVMMKKKITRTYDAGTVEVDGVVPQYEIEGTEGEGGITTAFQPAPTITPSFDATTTGIQENSGSKKSTKPTVGQKERYHTVNKKIDSANRKKDRAAADKDQAFGKSKLKYIDDEIEAIEDLQEAYKNYYDEIADPQTGYLAKDLQALNDFVDKNQGAIKPIIDQDGIISNWDQILDKEKQLYEEVMNGDNFDDAAKEAAEKRWDDINNLIQQYEDTIEEFEKVKDEQAALERERISKELERITVEVDFEIEINQRDLDKLDYIVEELNRGLHNAIEVIDALGQSVSRYENQSTAMRDGIDRIRANAAAEGRELTDDEQRQIWDYEDQLLDINRSLYDLMDTVDKQVLEEFQEFNDAIDENIERFNTYNEALDYYASIITLSGRATKDSALLMSIATQKVDTSMTKLNSSYDKYLANVEAQKDALAHLNAATTEEDKEYWQKQYDEITKAVETSHNEVLGSWEQVLQDASDKFDLAIQQTLETLKSSISEYGLDGLADRYEKATEEQERYLSNLDKEYELNKLSREIAKSIDETDNVHAKQELNKLLDEINKKQASGVKMSKYDLEIMQKQYDVEMAKLALEEARNAKSTVRLRKDNEGNFGYVYTADQDKVADAQQKYEDTLYALQKTSEDYVKEMSDMIIQNELDMINALENIDKTRFNTKEEYEAEVARITKYYLDKDLYLRQELDKAVVASGTTYGKTVLGQIEKASTWEEAHDNLKTNTNAAQQSMCDAWVAWKDTTTLAMETVGTSADGFTTTITTDLQAIGTATTTLASDIDTQTQNMENHIQGVMNKVAEFRQQYIAAIQAMIDKNKEWVGIQGTTLTAPTTPPVTETPPPEETPQEQAPEVKTEPVVEQPKKMSHSDMVDLVVDMGQGDYGNGSARRKAVEAKYPGICSTAQGILNQAIYEDSWNYHHNGNKWKSQTVDRLVTAAGYDTGGYTGVWGPEGKLAFLHEKELVLNKNDTSNLLSSVDLLHNIISQIDLMAASHSIFGGLMSPSYGGGQGVLEQDVHIEAHFPNATNHSEIEEAFGNLINLASQYANRK